MAEIIKHERYIAVDHINNSNKFWYITLFDDATTLVENGRVGSKPMTKGPKQHDSQEAAETFFEKTAAKKAKGKPGKVPYRKLDTMATTTAKSDAVDLESIVEEQIATSSVDTKKLLRYFIKQNIHNITSNTTITYNKQSGLFETPCGAVTKTSIDEARTTLISIAKYMKRDDRDERRYGMLVSEYLMLIPMKVGRKLLPDDIFCDKSDVEKQEGILDSLEATYETIINSATDDKGEKVESPKIFDVEFELLEDKAEIKRIKDMYNDTKLSMHMCHRMRPKRIFKVKIGHMTEQFEAKGRPVGNIKELWHGTRDGNVLSILKNGLMIPKSSEGHCTGRMFGDGIYFSDQSTKALNYAAGYWGGSRVNKCFMFLADVAMGKEFVPNRSDSRMHTRVLEGRYDSTFAKAGGCVRNNEMIVYKLEQANLKYIVEFEG